MMTHIVCWKYKPDTTVEQRADHIAQLKALPSIIPNIESFSVGSDVLHLERSFHTGLVSTYKDMVALANYIEDPEHKKVAALGKELSEQVVSVDFETE